MKTETLASPTRGFEVFILWSYFCPYNLEKIDLTPVYKLEGLA